MKYIPLFNSDPRVIAIGVCCLLIMLTAIIIPLLKFKVPFVKKWYTRLRLNKIMFFIGVIVGFSISAANHFQIFDESNSSYDWIKQSIYLVSSFVTTFVTIMFIWFMLIIPFRFFSNIYMFHTYRHPLKKFLKTTCFYLFFATIALLIATSQYGFENSFFAFSSKFSNKPLPLDINTHPTLYYFANYLLIKVFKIKYLSSTFYIGGAIIGVVIVEIIVIQILHLTKPHILEKMANVSDNVADKGQMIMFISPMFTFTAITTSLMVQPLATLLRIILVLLLMTMVAIAIFLINFIYTTSKNVMKFSEYRSLITKAIINAFSKPVTDQTLNDFVTNGKNHRAFLTFDKEQAIYNLLVTTIFPMVISTYLGFASGPLFKPLSEFSLGQHFIFWIGILILGYVYLFAYAFKFKNSAPFKIMLSNTSPYIKSGFNTGILNYFNAIIDRFAFFATYTTFISVAAKHEKQYRKLII